MDDLAAITKGLCTSKDERSCFDQFGEQGMAWSCSHCPKKRSTDINPYTEKLLRLVALQRGGYPIAADDLTVEEWIDLGMVKEALNSRTPCQLMMR